MLEHITEWSNTLVQVIVQTISSEDITVKYSDSIPE